jgi:biopolymer transport protein ExbD
MRTSRGRNFQAEGGSMTTMIDVVFLLLIFFMLTLKILPSEGEFQVQMPTASAAVDVAVDRPHTDIRIRLVANDDGSLNRLQLGRRNLGNDRRAFERLGHEMYGLVGRPGLIKDGLEITIDSDYHLNYEHVMQAVGAASGRIDPQSGRLIRYDTPIKFTAARRRGV